MKFLTASLLMLAVFPVIVFAKRRRVPFMNCPSAKSNTDLSVIRHARSRIECSVICLSDPDCLSASYCKTNNGYTCQLSGLYAEGSCIGFPNDGNCIQTAVNNPCENGATFVPQNRSCLCAGGFVGAYCHRRYRDCAETPVDDQRYYIQPLGSGYIFEWKCNSGYPLTQTVFAFSNIYNYTWQTMRSGVPSLPARFYFLGLESIHQLTKQGRYDMSVIMTVYGTGKAKLWYRNIRVDSEADGYALHWDYFERDPGPTFTNSIFLDAFAGAGDATKNLNGARFGTFDNDVNGCANVKGIGWWYNPVGCMTLTFNANGPHWPTNRSGTVSNEFINIFRLHLEHVNMYVEDDLVF